VGAQSAAKNYFAKMTPKPGIRISRFGKLCGKEIFERTSGFCVFLKGGFPGSEGKWAAFAAKLVTKTKGPTGAWVESALCFQRYVGYLDLPFFWSVFLGSGQRKEGCLGSAPPVLRGVGGDVGQLGRSINPASSPMLNIVADGFAS